METADKEQESKTRISNTKTNSISIMVEQPKLTKFISLLVFL